MYLRRPLLLLAVPLACLTLGCAQRTVVGVTPSTDELPRIEQVERTLPAKIGVVQPFEERRVVLVPDYEAPALTPEERLALGEEPAGPDWLEFYEPKPAVQRVWPGRGGAAVGTHGLAGALVGVVLSSRGVVVGSPGRPLVHEDYNAVSVSASATRSERPIAVPGTAPSGVRIGETHRGRTAARSTRAER